MEKRFTIWSNEDIKLEDWEDEFEDDMSENEKWKLAEMLNSFELENERDNLSYINCPGILAIGDIGRWNGRVSGYKEFKNISDCLFSECVYNTWYITPDGEFCCTAIHHDGTNYYRYRAWKPGVTEEQKEKLEELLFYNEDYSKLEDEYTEPLGIKIAELYGFRSLQEMFPDDTPEYTAVDEEELYTCYRSYVAEWAITGYHTRKSPMSYDEWLKSNSNIKV